MNISPLEEYALRCALQLAQLKPDQHVSASKIAVAEGISVEYASKIMFLFRSAGLADSVRGTNGGFKLNRSAEKVTLKAIFDSLSNKKKGEQFCEQHSGNQNQCVHLECCSIRPFWSMFSVFFDEISNAMTLEDLLGPEESVRERLTRITATSVREMRRATRG